MLNGGFLEEPDQFSSMSFAPAAEYTNQLYFQKLASTKLWSQATAEERYYIFTRGKMYGWIQFSIYSYYDADRQARIIFKFAINPSGSRVLR